MYRRDFMKGGLIAVFLSFIPITIAVAKAKVVETKAKVREWYDDWFDGPEYDRMAEALKKVREKGQFDYGKGTIGWHHDEYKTLIDIKDAAYKAHAKGPFDYSAKGARIGNEEEILEASKRKIEVHELLRDGKFKA